jgi:hypothetical protein
VTLAGTFLVGLTRLQWAPIPGLREVAAPQIAAQVSAALEGTDIVVRPRASRFRPRTPDSKSAGSSDCWLASSPARAESTVAGLETWARRVGDLVTREG